MKPSPVVVGSVWRERRGSRRTCRVTEITPQVVGRCARILNLDTGKLTWVQGWVLEQAWDQVSAERAA